MDELLHKPETRTLHTYRTVQTEKSRRREARMEALRDRFARFMAAAEVARERFQVWSTHTYHKASSAMAGRPLVDPLPFLAVAAVVGITATVGFMYTPSYVLTIDDEVVGTVRSQKVYEQMVDRVETRSGAILGHAYELDLQPSFEFALTKRGSLTPVAEVESYLFGTIDEIINAYSLTVNGQFIGAIQDRNEMNALLDAVKLQYVTENTVRADFVETIRLENEFLAATEEQDYDTLFAALTANTNGQTTYEVVQGDTFMAIALANNMTVTELEELNPDININRLYIGQLLNVKEEIPFLSVRTVDNLTYEEAIECPVEEIEDHAMYQGESRVVTKGVPGVARINADVTYLNGKEEERTVLSSETLQEPTVRVIAVGTKERPSWYPTGNFIWPVNGRITSRFGWRYIFGSNSYHSGLDIKATTGQSVKAADGGTVTYAGYKSDYGYLVVIDHGNGKQTYYGHNSKLKVSRGDKVHQGQTIALAGSTGRSTGPHCHFEVRIDGTRVNPLSYLP